MNESIESESLFSYAGLPFSLMFLFAFLFYIRPHSGQPCPIPSLRLSTQPKMRMPIPPRTLYLYRYLATGAVVLRGSQAIIPTPAAFRSCGTSLVTPSLLGPQLARRNLSILTESNKNMDSAIIGCAEADCPSQGIVHMESFEGKIVPLGAGFSVRRILPFRKQRSVGPFVFLDHFGPVAMTEHAMNVGPHPHIGLMTVTFLFEGAILHRDSTGAEQIVLPGEVNGMIGGRGVTHSERGLLKDMEPFLKARNVPAPTGSHGLQLWMALPKDGEDVEPSFHHGKAVSINAHAMLVVGQSNGLRQASIPIDPKLGKVFYVDTYFESPNDTFVLEAPGGSDNVVGSDNSIELGVYVSSGKAEFASGWGRLDGQTLEPGHMITFKAAAANDKTQVRAIEGDTRVALLGGSPLPEKRHMFWNFLSTSKDKVDAATKAWEQLDRSVFPEVVNESNKDSLLLPGQKKM
jgi:redox-sensitive bicupin YhaK (pirin superfamily)